MTAVDAFFTNDERFCANLVPSDGALLVRLVGELDAPAAPLVVEMVVDLGRVDVARVDVDLSDLRLIDSSGVRALLRLVADLRAHGLETRVTERFRPVVADVLRISGALPMLL